MEIALIIGILVIILALYIRTKVAFKRHCPNCGATQLSKLHRPQWAKRMPVKLYACKSCKRKFYQLFP